MDYSTGSQAPESYEEMTDGQRADWFRARGNLASERPQARIVLREKFALMTAEERKMELNHAKAALDCLDELGLIGDSHEEEPLERDYRIRMEETVSILTTDPDLTVG